MGTAIGIRRRRWFWALLLTAAFVAPAHAFRCNGRLVHEGDTRAQVAAKCGDPTEIHRTTALRRPVFWIHGRPYHLGDGLVEVQLESWIYNLGPNKLMRRVRFEDGIVVEIETLGYGYHEKSLPDAVE
ncbi:MAG TPA: DUF2845 domain-containing protein [Steroidobacteraceae bacterium]